MVNLPVADAPLGLCQLNLDADRFQFSKRIGDERNSIQPDDQRDTYRYCEHEQWGSPMWPFSGLGLQRSTVRRWVLNGVVLAVALFVVAAAVNGWVGGAWGALVGLLAGSVFSPLIERLLGFLRRTGHDSRRVDPDRRRQMLGKEAKEPVDGTGRVVPAQLPADTVHFLGRQHELGDLQRRFISARDDHDPAPAAAVVAIFGKPGVGKSAMAIHLAHQLAARFPDGQLYVNLRGGEGETKRVSPEEVLTQFLRALGVADQTGLTSINEQTALYWTLLASREVLIVLDNAANEDQVRPLLPGRSTSAVLITSRRRLSGLVNASSLELKELDPFTGVELLRQLAGEDRIGADPAATKIAEQIAHHCGYLPLTLRIAGARLRARTDWPLATLAGKLADERRRLRELRAGDLEVQSTFAVSYRDINNEEKRTFRLLGLLSGPDMEPDVVAELTGRTREECELILESLVDAQLLETPAPDRYRFHDLLRLFARERARAEEDQATLKVAVQRTLDWYLETVGHATELLKPESLQRVKDDSPFRTKPVPRRAALDWLEIERPNLVAATRQAAETPANAHAWQLAEGLFDFFNLRKYWEDWQVTTEFGLEAANRAGDQGAEGRMRHNLGYVLRDRRQYEAATSLLEQSVELLRDAGDRQWEARALGTLGTAYRVQKRFDDAIESYRQSLTIRQEIHDRLGEGHAYEALGTAYWQQHNLERAVVALDKGLDVFRKIGGRREECRILGIMGHIYVEQRRLKDARSFLDQSLRIAQEVGARYVESRTLTDLGRLYAEQGRGEDAMNALERSREIFELLKDPYAQGQTLRNLGLAAEATGNQDAARSYWTRAVEILTPISMREAEEIETWLDKPDHVKSWWSEFGI